MFYIYRIVNNINNKIYVGQTNNPKLRWQQHKSAARRDSNNYAITRAISKYGDGNFLFEVIVTCKINEAISDIEIYVIKQYKSNNPKFGYNITSGGENFLHNDVSKKKISEKLTKFYEENDHHRKGVDFSKEHREKLSKAATGRKGTNIGRRLSKEWKRKLSESNKGQIRSQECRNNLSKSHIGQIPSNRKLTKDKVEELRNYYKNNKITQKELAKMYGLSQTSVNLILLYKTYKD